MAKETAVMSALEAILFVGGAPITLERFQAVLQGMDQNQIVELIAELNQLYHQQNRPYEVRNLEAGYQLVLRREYDAIRRNLYQRNRHVRLSRAAVEVLSIVAYRQPVTANEVDALRGADSGAVLRQLRRRNLIQTVDRENHQSRGSLLGTTRRFRELFQLSSLEDLPRVQIVDEL